MVATICILCYNLRKYCPLYWSIWRSLWQYVLFFGHSDTSNKIEVKLKEVITDLIKKHNVNEFYVGTHGNFDNIVKKTLIELKNIYPHITYTIVLSHLNFPKEHKTENYTNYIYPENFENTPPKYDIIRRNRWLIEQSDYVITYVEHTLSNAYKFKEIAEKKGKIVINII